MTKSKFAAEIDDLEIPSNADHLFINYATEDAAFAEWLTLKLTAEGYRVWCDKFKLLGGESYPSNIDDAIKNGTFRVISLLSKFSIDKPNPKKERTLALNIARERKTDFVIPLNVDGLKPTELDWLTSDLTFIDFSNSWASGLRQLLTKLQSINCPQPLKDGKSNAAEAYFQQNVVCNEPETLYSNCLEIIKIPPILQRFASATEVFWWQRQEILKSWACYQVNSKVFLAFTSPPLNLRDQIKAHFVENIAHEGLAVIDNIPTANILSFLLRQSINVECLKRGLMVGGKENVLYFPSGLLPKNKLYFYNHKKKKCWLSVSGSRKYWTPKNDKERNHYFVSPGFLIKQDHLNCRFIVQLRVSLHLKTESGEDLSSRSVNSRRKRICMSWWNDKWFNLHLAICYFLSNGQDEIVIGDKENEKIILSSKFKNYESAMRIDEAVLDEIKKSDLEMLANTGEEMEPSL